MHVKLRVPQDVRRTIADWTGYWAAVNLLPSGELRIRYYAEGEASALFTRRETNDYYLWDETRRVRLYQWHRADEMWEFVREILDYGPDHNGLVQLSV
ncbi:MAG: hypothetical protein ACTSPX_01200 [Candidatus Thorarchaeota archaeon]